MISIERNQGANAHPLDELRVGGKIPLTKILVADDSATIQKVIKIAFARLAYEMLEATSYPQASTFLGGLTPPALIILDAHLSGLHGPEGIHKLLNGKKIPVLLLVGSYDAINEDQYRQAGFHHFLRKPFESVDIVSYVEKLLSGGSKVTHGSPPLPQQPSPPPQQSPSAFSSQYPGAIPQNTPLPPQPNIPQAAHLGHHPGGYNPQTPMRTPPMPPPMPPSTSPPGQGSPRIGLAMEESEAKHHESLMGGGPLPPPPLSVSPSMSPSPPLSASSPIPGLSLLQEELVQAHTERQIAFASGGEIHQKVVSKPQVSEGDPGELAELLDLIRGELPALVSLAVKEYCDKHFAALAREVIMGELRRLADEKARHLVDN